MSDVNDRSAAGVHVAGPPPSPDPAFHWSRETWGLGLRSSLLEPHAQHLFTSTQLRLPSHATAAERERAWAAIAASLGVRRDRLLRVRQVHGREVRVVRGDAPSTADPVALPDGDALVSNLAGSALLVVVADCVPILVVDPRAGAAAAIHAGWRGTCAGVTVAAITTMGEVFGSRPGDLVAALGPSIGPDDYDVGEPVVDAFRAAGHADAVARWFLRTEDRLRLDLWRANVDQLTACGVPRAQIAVSGLSTAAHPGWLESYRRDGPSAGRLVASIVVPAVRGAGARAV